MRTTKHLLALGVCALAPFGLIACGDTDEDAANSATPAATASGSESAKTPEEIFAPDSEVAPGLENLTRLAASIAATPDKAAAKQKAEGLEDIWKPIEGTVKRNEPDQYATIEEDLSLLESGEPARTRAGATEMAKIVKAYVAAHPG